MLSFFSNSTGYGSSLPFQRQTDPAQIGFYVNLEQAELLRIQRYNEAWRFYFGRQWLFKREDNEPLVTINYFKKLIDKNVAFAVGGGFGIKVPTSLQQITKPLLDEVWKYNNRQSKTEEIALTDSLTGDAFIMITYEEPSAMQRRVNPFSEGKIRLNLLGSEQCYPKWDPLSMDTLLSIRIETLFYSDTQGDQQPNSSGKQLSTRRFTQIITPDYIIEQFHGEMPVTKPNPLGEIPVVHIKNLPIPREYYGYPDSLDLIDLQRELNEKATDISDIINYHAAPTTIIIGAKAKQIEKSSRAVWSGLPLGATVQNLAMSTDLSASNAYKDFIKRALHEISDVPEGSLGAQMAISNTSGVALHMLFQPLIERARRKRAQLEPGVQQINYFILRIAQIMRHVNLPFDLCKHCGGRIVPVPTTRSRLEWSEAAQALVSVPIVEKRCYHIDKQTLEFMDPSRMRLKIWKSYGFGDELVEMTKEEIEKQLKDKRASYWDYTVVLKKLEAEAAELMAKQTGQVFMPTELPKLPLPFTFRQVPASEIDVPEEPEIVNVPVVHYHPRTGEVILQEQQSMALVPTGCRQPQYQDPFENEVTFSDVLPKDQALLIELFKVYLELGLVDKEWVQERIPEIAESMHELAQRKKIAESTPNPMGAGFQQLAPPQTPQASVPGPNGNPVPVTGQNAAGSAQDKREGA